MAESTFRALCETRTRHTCLEGRNVTTTPIGLKQDTFFAFTCSTKLSYGSPLSDPTGLEPATRGLSDHALTLLCVSIEPHAGFGPATFSMARRRATTTPMGLKMFLAEGAGFEPTSEFPRGGFQDRCLTVRLTLQDKIDFLLWLRPRPLDEWKTNLHEGIRTPRFSLGIAFYIAVSIFIRAYSRTRTCEGFRPQFCRLCPLPLGFM